MDQTGLVARNDAPRLRRDLAERHIAGGGRCDAVAQRPGEPWLQQARRLGTGLGLFP
jgi:hypothetical protein